MNIRVRPAYAGRNVTGWTRAAPYWRRWAMDKQALMSYRDLAREVRQLRANLDALEASMYTPKGQRYTRTPHASSGKGKTMEDVVCKHIELEELYVEKLAEKNDQLLRVEQAVESLPDAAERLVLRLRYIDGYSWDRISQEMAYSVRSVYRLHGLALLHLKEV